MRILIIGAGVLGCNLAANLYKAKKDVTLLARGKWYDQISKNGLKIKNKFVPWENTYKINVISELANDDIYDAIIISLRFTQVDSIIETLNNNASKNIIFNGNNTRVQKLVDKLPDKNVMFSFSLSAGAREENRVNSIDLGKITIGDVNGNNNEAFINQLFENTKYKVVYQPNMKDYLLSHAAFVVPVSFACYYTNGNLKKIKNDRDYIEKIIEANKECYRALQKSGVEILPKEDQDFETQKWHDLTKRFYKIMSSTSLGKLCASDHAMNAADEMQALAADLKAIMTETDSESRVYDELWKPLANKIGT